MERTDFEPWNSKDVARLLALVENQKRYYQDMVSGLPVGLVVLSANRSVVSSNRAFRQAFSVSTEALRGKTIEQVLPSDRLIEKIREMTVHGIPQPGFLLDQGGKLLRIAILPIRNPDEETEIETLLMVTDVTDVRQVPQPAAAPPPAENLPATAQRNELEQLRITAERISALHSLSARLAHDLNNPLMIISGYAEEMLNPLSAGDPRRADLEQILAATTRIGNLTAQLLEFTRKHAGRVERVELAAMLSGLGGKIGRIPKESIKPVWALANRAQLEEILLALASALRNDAASVTIACDTAALAAEPYARVTLHAAGYSMEAEKRKVIFESFLHKDSDLPAGAALARAYAIVKEWGGELSFESDSANGSTFALYLPPADPEPQSTPRTRARTAPAAGGPQRGTVLVVDDESGIRELIVKILRRERYFVLEAGSATEALAVASGHDGPIHLLLTDVMLPDRNGRELAKQLREALPEVKVMYISGYTDDESVRAGVFPPGARFLQKPFTLSALIGTVKEALSR